MTTPQSSDKTAEHYRVHKLRLDPTEAQRARFDEEARAAKWAYNTYLNHWETCQNNWRRYRGELITHGLSTEEATKKTKQEATTNPSLKALSWTAFSAENITPLRTKHQRAEQLLRRLTNPELHDAQHRAIVDEITQLGPWTNVDSVDNITPWLHKVHRRSLTTGLKYAHTAIQNYLTSLRPNYSGPRVGRPRYKRPNARKSIVMDAETIGAYGAYDFRTSGKITNYHRVRLGPFRSVRTHNSTKPLSRDIQRGGNAKSFTLTEKAGHWYVSILLEFDTPQVRPTTHKQRENHSVGVDFGVRNWGTLSDGRVFSLPAMIKDGEKKIANLQRKLARAQKGSNRRRRLLERIAKAKHTVALQKETFLHEVSKELATHFDLIGIEDLNIRGMTASARGTIEQPGNNVRAKSGLNRSILAGSPYEFRRQLEYKARRYGSKTVLIDRFYASSKTCSRCGKKKENLTLKERQFHCTHCGLTIDRDLNAALNIKAEAEKSSTALY